MSLLTLKDVTYKYDGASKYVLNNVNVEFKLGKIYTIIGKSGAGKSTLLALISGLDVSTDGEILFDGVNIKSINRDNYRARSIGVIFQSFNLLSNATAIENIILSMNISGNRDKKNKEIAYNLLEKVGIDKETANRKILKLSGGEQQRVAIARALSHNPDIIIADEPTGNLDKETEGDVLKILTSLSHNEGKCIIVVTHSRKVSSIADEVWGISDGKMIPVSQSKLKGK